MSNKNIAGLIFHSFANRKRETMFIKLIVLLIASSVCHSASIRSFLGRRSTSSSSLAPDKLFEPDPPLLKVSTKGLDWIELTYNVSTPSSTTILYNLIMNGISIYSGTKPSYKQRGLDEATCYSFQVSALLNGEWTKFTAPLRTSLYDPLQTSVQSPRPSSLEVDMGQYMEQVKSVRDKITEPTCPLPSILYAGYLSSGNANVEYTGQSGEITSYGNFASRLNCLYSKCNDGSSTSKTFRQAVSGSLSLRMDDGKWSPRFFSIPAEGSVLEYNSPSNPVLKDVVSLVGCRANALPMLAQVNLQRIGPAADLCMQVNCTTNAVPLYLCQEDVSQDIKSWMAAINLASHPHRIVRKFEVLVKVSSVTVSEDVTPGNRFEQNGYREAFILSYLSTQTVENSCPHFPLILGIGLCPSLPEKWDYDAGPDGGLISPYTEGAAIISNVNLQKAEGGFLRTQWSSLMLQSFNADLGSILRSYKDLSLDNDFVRGVIFQLIYTLGSARQRWGLFHNDLLSLSNSIRFQQVVPQSPLHREQWCYTFNDPNYIPPPSTPAGEPAPLKRDPCKPEEIPPPTDAAPPKTWCIFTSQVDGLQLKLHNFASAVLKKEQLKWWKEGFTFQNVRWGDDMVDVAIILCDIMGLKVNLFSPDALDLCTKAKAGLYYKNPFDALHHPYFQPLNDNGMVKNSDLFVHNAVPIPSDNALGTAAGNTAAPGSPAVPTSAGSQVVRASANSPSPSGVPSAKDLPTIPPSLKSREGSAAIHAMFSDDTLVPSEDQSVDALWIKLKTENSTMVGWTHPKDVLATMPVMFNLMMNDVSVYSGTAHDHEQYGMDSETCYRFSVAALINGVWSKQSNPVFVNNCAPYRDKVRRTKRENGDHILIVEKEKPLEDPQL